MTTGLRPGASTKIAAPLTEKKVGGKGDNACRSAVPARIRSRWDRSYRADRLERIDGIVKDTVAAGATLEAGRHVRRAVLSPDSADRRQTRNARVR